MSMRKRYVDYEYTCCVCGKVIPKGQKVLIVNIPCVIDLGEDGRKKGGVEWYAHDSEDRKRGCVYDLIRQFEGVLKAQYVYPGCDDED